MRDMTHRHDPFIRVTCHISDLTYSYVWHDLYTNQVSFIRVTWLKHHAWLIFAFICMICVTWLIDQAWRIHMCDMTDTPGAGGDTRAAHNCFPIGLWLYSNRAWTVAFSCTSHGRGYVIDIPLQNETYHVGTSQGMGAAFSAHSLEFVR